MTAGDAESTAADALERSPLFEGLARNEREEIVRLTRLVEFAPGAAICREGEPGTSLFVLVEGLTDVLVPGEAETEVRLGAGDVIGEMSLVTGEARSATVLATVPTTALELDGEAFAGVVVGYPSIGANLSRIVSRRLARTRRAQLRGRGESVALLLGASADGVLAEIVHAAECASARPITVLDARGSLEGALAALDDALLANGTVLLVGDSAEAASPVVEQADRALALVDDADTASLERLNRKVEVLDPRTDRTWLGRHLTRTKLGLALGAGGAKGYAHVGTIEVLERAGYTVDCIAGASVGAIVGALLALGLDAAEIAARMRRAFSPDRVAEMFKMSFTGAPTETVKEAFREATEDKTFDDLVIPLSVMTVDLESRRPAPVTDGPLWEALLAATALAGMYPPYRRGNQRLVDGLALVPVPTGAAVALGADVTISVNILNRDTLEAWPGDVPVPEAPPGRAGSMMLDTMLEVMDLSQLEASIRHAELADVVVSPRFGPCSWRDFHLADLFLEAGRQATGKQLALLQSMARPQGAACPS
jgi:NTE family protein